MSTELAQFEELKASIACFVSPTFQLTVTDFASAQSAIEAVKQVKGFINQLESKRKELVGPLNDQVKAINGYAGEIKDPLIRSEEYLKKQITQFEVEQERLREIARKAAEAERIAEEQRAAAEAELARKELESAQADEREQEAQVAALFGSDDEASEGEEPAPSPEERRLQEKIELDAQIEGERALRTAKANQEDWDRKQLGVKNSRKVWKCELEDISKVPREFLIIELNQAAVLAAARGGQIIPGVRTWQETTLAVGAKTYIPRTALGR